MRKPIVAAVCVAVAVGLAGCSGTTAGTATAGPGASAGTPAAVAPAAFTSAADLAGALRTASGDKTSAKLAFTFGLGNESVTGTGAYSGSGGDARMQMTMKVAQQGDLDMIVIGGDIYVKIPGAPGGKPWIKASTSSGSAIDKEFAGFGDHVDVAKQVAQLDDGGTITGSSSDTVDGTPATKYTITLDPAKLAANGTPQQQAAIQTVIEQGVSSIDMTMWVTSDNLPLRISYSVPLQGQNTSFDMRYSDWGQPVDISAPPADQVTETPS